MYERAKELDKNGHADQAIAMLKTVAKQPYEETATANEPRLRLTRGFEKNLPLFATGPDRRRPGSAAYSSTRSALPKRWWMQRPAERNRPRARQPWCCQRTHPRWSLFPHLPDRRIGPAATQRRLDRCPPFPGQSCRLTNRDGRSHRWRSR